MSTSTRFKPVLVAHDRARTEPARGSSADDARRSGRTLYEGKDPSAIHRAVSARLGPHRLHVPDGRVNADFRLLYEGGVSLYEISYGGRADVYFDGTGQDILIPLRHRGWGRAVIDNVEGPISPCVLVPGRRAKICWEPDTVALIARISRAALEQALAYTHGAARTREPQPGPYLDTSDVSVRQWLALAKDFGTMVDSGRLMGSRSATRHFEQVLIHGLLACRSTRTGARHVPDTSAEPSGLRRALDYCAEHATDPVSVAAVARAAGMSVRTLQEKFRVHLGVTPVGYLRRLRLAGAHADLLRVAEGRTKESVTDIALRWGFSHLGRFGSLYREVYGRLPSQTLRHGAELGVTDARVAG